MTGGATVSVTGQQLHYRRLGTGNPGSPIVFLHEGLGSVELWRTFPQDVIEATGRPGLAYSRHGNGWSSPLTRPRRPDYMHEEALEVLPRIVDELVGQPPILVGHSDGASIAIIYAGAGHPVKGLVLIAPHVFVEEQTTGSIAWIRDEFPDTEMGEKMARYHADPETTFYGWADIWLSPEFRSWNIEDHVRGVACPTMLIQGDADEYGTTAQLDAIDAGLGAPAGRLIAEGAGHSPHLSHPDQVIAAVTDFIDGLA